MLLGRLRNRILDASGLQPVESIPVPQLDEDNIELTEGYDNRQNFRHQMNPPETSMEESATEQADKEKSPLAILEDIKKDPSPKGTFATIIGGRPVDLHILEDYIVKISPYSLKTILRYHNAKTIEEIKNYSRGMGVGAKINMRTIMIILIVLGLAIGGIIILSIGCLMLGIGLNKTVSSI